MGKKVKVTGKKKELQGLRSREETKMGKGHMGHKSVRLQ